MREVILGKESSQWKHTWFDSWVHTILPFKIPKIPKKKIKKWWGALFGIHMAEGVCSDMWEGIDGGKS